MVRTPAVWRDASSSACRRRGLTPRLATITVRDLGRTPHPELNENALQALFTPPEQRTPEQGRRA
jgi:FMN-dependent NADH-azoreductase